MTLAVPVDYREQVESMFNEEIKAIKLATDGILLRHEQYMGEAWPRPNRRRFMPAIRKVLTSTMPPGVKKKGGYMKEYRG